MRPKTKTITLVALDRDGISSSADPASGANLTLAGALTSGGVYTADVPRHIAIYAAGNESAKTFTVTGTDRKGLAMTEAITGPNATTVAGKKNFATVTQIAVTGDAGECEAGTYNSAETAWIPVEFNIGSPYQIAVTMSDDATQTAQVQYTLEDVFSSTFDEHACRKFYGIPDKPCRAIRLRISGFTDGTSTVTIICPR